MKRPKDGNAIPSLDYVCTACYTNYSIAWIICRDCGGKNTIKKRTNPD